MNTEIYANITFPTFGIDVNPPRMFHIGSFSAYYYGLVIAFGLFLAAFYAMRRCKQFGLKQDDILDGVIWVTPFAIICARAYYVIFSWQDYVKEPMSVFYIWEGGLAIYGGVLGAILGIWVLSRVKKLKFTTVLDIVLLGFLIGQSIGRWGNFFNREAFGAPTDCLMRMGLLNTETGLTEYYHPTFLYESLWNAVGFIGLHFLSKRRRYDGQVALGYAAWYGLGRTVIEGLRMDSLYWGPFRVSQMLAALSCLAAVTVLIWQSFKPHDPADLFVNRRAEEAKKEEKTEET